MGSRLSDIQNSEWSESASNQPAESRPEHTLHLWYGGMDASSPLEILHGSTFENSMRLDNSHTCTGLAISVKPNEFTDSEKNTFPLFPRGFARIIRVMTPTGP